MMLHVRLLVVFFRVSTLPLKRDELFSEPLSHGMIVSNGKQTKRKVTEQYEFEFEWKSKIFKST